jgi:hypothetical protein
VRAEDAYARLTPVRDSLYGLAFRSYDKGEGAAHDSQGWEPLLLIDALEDLVEHALIAIDAVDALPDRADA